MRTALLLATALLLLPATQAVQVTVHRNNPIVGLQDPDFRDNPLSLDDSAFDGGKIQVELGDAAQLAPVDALEQAPSPLAWGNRRIVIADGLGVPDGSVTRRDDPRFMEQMVFVYADHGLARLEALGYNLTAETPVYAYAHDPPAFRGGLVPSPSLYPDAYVPSQRQMHFMFRAPSPQGDGGTGSSAEDADVIVHELGHIVHARAATHVRYTQDWYGRWAEGVGDLFAALVMEDFNEGYGDACISEWLHTYYPDGFMRFQSEGLGCIRALDNTFAWPEDEFGEIHRDSQFWSGALWTVRQSIGSDATLRLLMESFPHMPEEISSFQDIGSAFLLADAATTGGDNEGLIRDAFAAHGIALPTLAELLPADGALPTPVVAVPDSAGPAPVPQGAPASKDAPASTLGLAILAVAFALARRRTR